ncbi:yippee-like protein [Serendipita vermifera]|nr:yippee-like protein [Serendipita vermifera]
MAAIQAFEGKPKFACAQCSTTVALADELISKSFSGREGRGPLLHSACNIRLGKHEQRQLLTGVHTVADMFCVGCSARLGWTYLRAHETSQKYKEGKYLFERERIFKDNAWELEDH